MADAGLFRGQRVELIGGDIVEMVAQKDTHVIGVSLAAKTIASAFGVGFWVHTQAPLNLGKKDDPEPDVAVVPGSERDYIGSQNRADALLVVEVSDTTLAYDRGRKAAVRPLGHRGLLGRQHLGSAVGGVPRSGSPRHSVSIR
jgi:Uma2 family endonuclease